MTKSVAYQCTWSACRVVIPVDDERIRAQIEGHRGSLKVFCPECGSPMQRKLFR